MKIIFGLGNPGDIYLHTRHNAGFMFVDYLQRTHSFSPFAYNKKFHADISEGSCGKFEKIILAKPLKFMNLSGEVIQNICNYYKITPSDIIIAHDDLDIEIGTHKITTNSRAAGHNGVQNIIDSLGTQDFKRVRIGIEAQGGRLYRDAISGEKFVLQKFSPQELALLSQTYPVIANDLCTQ